MTVGALLYQATQQLSAAGIDTARLDCLILLEDVLGQDRASLLAHDDQPLTDQQLKTMQQFVAQRSTHQPLAYLRGKAMFYGRIFTVGPAVLVPRPETETLIELVLKLDAPVAPRIADIGTGSGCIGITLALELPESTVALYDISSEALAIARQNAASLDASVTSHTSDLLQHLVGAYDIVVANLPYVPDAHPINRAASFEPELALFAGVDGLDAYRTFWQQVSALATKPRYILTESLPSQHHPLAVMARNHGYVLERSEGYIQVFSPS